MVVLSTDALPQLRMSIDEYLDADLPEGHRYELVAGVVEVSPIPGIPHDESIVRLQEILILYRQSRPDLVAHVSQRAAVALRDRDTAREPDLAVFGAEEWTRRSKLGLADLKPTLVVEAVSPGRATRDYRDKRTDYWEAGVPEYWILDPAKRTLTVLVRGQADWVESTFADGDTFRPTAFPGLEVAVGRVFGA